MTPATTSDDTALAKAAGRFLDPVTAQPAAPRTLEAAFERAYAVVEIALADVRASREATHDDLPARLAPRRDETLAAILLLARYTLLDLAECPMGTYDLELAHRDLALYAEALFRCGAVGGLRALHALAAHESARRPSYWQNVVAHCAHLVGLIDHREEDAPAYIAIFGREDPAIAYHPYAGTCAAMRLRAALPAAIDNDDLPMLCQTFVRGSARAVAELLAALDAAHLPRDHYARLLAPLLSSDTAPERLAATVLAASRANRAYGARGDAMLNRVLMDVTLTEDVARLQVARIAVHELGAAGNEDGLIYIAEFAPLLGVAEEAVVAMKDLRRLLRVEPAAARRRGLRPVFLACRDELTEVRNLVDAVWAAASRDTAEVYVERLRQLRAYPELATIAQLASRRQGMADIAAPRPR